MIKKKINDAINQQVNREIFSAYLYLSMAAYFESSNLKGVAKWMKVQTQEEMKHAGKFMDYLYEKGGRAILDAIDKPEKEWDSPLAAFEAAYKHELKITAHINDLVKMASQDSDYATLNMLQWFVSEQVEEEAQTDEVVQKLKMIGDSKSALFMYDAVLGKRGE
jgi:ferritin